MKKFAVKEANTENEIDEQTDIDLQIKQYGSVEDDTL